MVMYAVVVTFLALALILYVLLGGADFGAGIIQLLSTTPKAEKTISRAIGPIWEANHMWLIIAVVITFMGFPKLYTTISVALHIPVFALLLGIIVRGTAYVYKNYDAIKDERSQKLYQQLFVWSSVLTSILLGMTFGAMALGRINLEASTFYEGYIAPWFNLFSFAVGLLAMAIFAFLAAVYLIGENKDPEVKQFFIHKASRWLMATIVLGALVFVAAAIDGYPLFQLFVGSPVALLAAGLAIGSLPLLFIAIRRGMVLWSRLLAGAQVVAVLGVWILLQYPDAIHLASGHSLTLLETRAADAALSTLGWALLLGSIFILPALGYLYRVFKLPQAAGGE